MYTIHDLTELMARLRDPETGCPWDLKQDFASVLPHTLEEAYEVADAIERQDWPHLEEELGDLLFQVIFYGQMGKESERFTLDSIIDRLVQKLIRRHPHVFPEGTLESRRRVDEVLDDATISQRWESIKQEEKAALPNDEPTRLLDDVPVSLPALSRAAKLQKKASSVGFDWPDTVGVVGKIREELDEVLEELHAGNREALEKEIGDLLFAVVNLARHQKINPENALRGTNQRFTQRFALVEADAQSKGGWGAVSLEEMDEAWNAAKRQLRDTE